MRTSILKRYYSMTRIFSRWRTPQIMPGETRVCLNIWHSAYDAMGLLDAESGRRWFRSDMSSLRERR